MTEGSAPKHGAKVIYFFILYFFYMIFLFSQFNHHNKLTTNPYNKNSNNVPNESLYLLPVSFFSSNRNLLSKNIYICTVLGDVLMLN